MINPGLGLMEIIFGFIAVTLSLGSPLAISFFYIYIRYISS